MMNLRERHHFLQLLYDNRVYSLIVFSLGIGIGWNARLYLENPVFNFFSLLRSCLVKAEE